VNLSLRFDLRVPPGADTDHRRQYEACLEMCSWGERLGFRTVWLSEHHGTEDGYLPAPFTLAAAILARCPDLRVTVSAALFPFHDPVRLAEQLAVVDLLAPGRLRIVAGSGYRRAEFTMAGISRGSRGRLLEEAVVTMRRAWTGEPFTHDGREVVVTPAPATPGGPQVWMGGSSVAAARRAGRLRCGMLSATDDAAVETAYREACAEAGWDGRWMTTTGPVFVMVSEDPESTWAEVGRQAVHDVTSYAAWQESAEANDALPATTLDDVRASGRYLVLTPDECVVLARSQGHVTLHPLMGGITPEVAWTGLRCFEERVLPQLAG
jgi:alkanesulfonate monooxygenase SsuD/methylene tetrahydromethanopterin reductase-like flavin-dependent oxidoreductase (luciferase family)